MDLVVTETDEHVVQNGRVLQALHVSLTLPKPFQPWCRWSEESMLVFGLVRIQSLEFVSYIPPREEEGELLIKYHEVDGAFFFFVRGSSRGAAVA